MKGNEKSLENCNYVSYCPILLGPIQIFAHYFITRINLKTGKTSFKGLLRRKH